MSRILFALLLSLCIQSANAADPTVEQAEWFAGEWLVGPAPIEGFDTIVTQALNPASIQYLEGSTIQRKLTLKGKVYTMAYEVKSFGGNFPWWGANGGNYVAKKLNETSFILAPVSNMGKAEWDRGWLYARAELEE
jgi:hypothetical protein